MIARHPVPDDDPAGILTGAQGCRFGAFGRQFPPGSAAPELHPRLKDHVRLMAQKELFLGYPINMKTPPQEFFAWREQLHTLGIGDFAHNNGGDPFKPSPVPFQTHELERELILRFARLYGFPSPDTWGFLSHSGTDSNMHGLYMGRTILKGRTGVMPKCYFTAEAHYSIQILRDLLGLDGVQVATLADAAMDPEDLRRKLAENPDAPALVIATIGTTFKGAIDRVDDLQQALRGRDSYLHVDAALFGGYLPHTAGAGEVRYAGGSGTGRGRFDSIAVSCHKFFGFSSPAGLFITTRSNFERFNERYRRIHNPEYIGHVPGTITCSRDALKPAEFYFFSSPEALARQAEEAREILQLTDYLSDQLHTHFSDLRPRRENHLSNIVYFRQPGERVVEKYSLATMRLEVDGTMEDHAHVVVMPHVNREVLDRFLADLETA